ncbi:hypothetical protein PFISCL1PPCAC_13931, partial [Pristionchus fissidentatus]
VMTHFADPLLVRGDNNRSYWLMLLVRSDAITHAMPLYHMAVMVEIALTLGGFYLHYRNAIMVWRCRIVHINLMIIGVNLYAVMVVGSTARLLTILYETRTLVLPSLGLEPIPSLAIVRQTSYGIANGIIVSAVALLPNIFCALMFRRMLNYNKKRHARLTSQIKRNPNDEYSLSLRVQLRENVWSMQKIEFGVYAVTAALAINLLVVFLPVLFLTDPGQFELLQWFTCVGNVGYALSITATAPILEIVVAIHRGRVPCFLVRFFGREP